MELLKEVTYYSKARTGAGVRFQAAVQAAVVRAARHPLGGAPVLQGNPKHSGQGLSVQRRLSPVAARGSCCSCGAPSQAPAVLGSAHRVTPPHRPWNRVKSKSSARLLGSESRLGGNAHRSHRRSAWRGHQLGHQLGHLRSHRHRLLPVVAPESYSLSYASHQQLCVTETEA